VEITAVRESGESVRTGIAEAATAPAAPRLPGVRLVAHRARWLLVGLAVGIVVGSGVAHAHPSMYQSTAIITVGSTSTTDSLNLSRAAQALARLATQPGLVSTPLRDAGLTQAADAPAKFVMVQAAPDAPIISVTGSATRAVTAQRVAQTVSSRLASVSPLRPFTAVVVAPPAVPDAPMTPSWAISAGAGAAGLTLALVLAATIPSRQFPASEEQRPS